MIEKNCPACFSVKIKKVFDKNDVPYYRCQECDFLFSGQLENPNLENQSLEEYDTAYISYLEESQEDNINFCKLVEKIEQFKPLQQARVLDIGAGTGKLVRFLRRRSVDAYGIEPSEVLYKHYLSKEPFFNLADIRRLREISPLVLYDVVIISDVIEHVRDPHVFFADLKLVLNPKAIVFISTPDAGSFPARICRKHWHYIHKYHFSFFSRKTLNAMTRRYGLTELSFSHAARYKSIGFIVQYFIDYVVKGKWQIPKGWNRWTIPMNLFDCMQVIFEKKD